MTRPHVARAQARLAASLLVDTCTIWRPDYTGAINATTLALADSGEQIWEGACYVNYRPADAGAGYVSIEALGRTDQKVRIRLPIDCPPLLPDDAITVTASDNATLTGVVFDVLEDGTGTFTVSKVVRARVRTRVR